MGRSLKLATLIVGTTLFYFCLPQDVLAQETFFLAENGVTVKCPDAQVGETGTVTINGSDVTFTKHNRFTLELLRDSAATQPSLNDGQWERLCITGVTDLSELFDEGYGSFVRGFNQDIGNWDTSSVTTMFSMFDGASDFNQDLSAWDTSQVTNMEDMFRFASSFNGAIGTWDVSNVTTMREMFDRATIFNQDISDWDTGSVTEMSAMFFGTSAFNQPIGEWDVSQVTSFGGMFWNATAFNQPIGSWDVSSAEAASSSMQYMFHDATAFNQDLSTWCVAQFSAQPTNFYGSANQAWGTNTALQPLWGQACAFSLAANGTTIECDNAPLGQSVTINGRSVTKRSAAQLTRTNAARTCTSGITDMSGLFETATPPGTFNEDITHWDTSDVTTMARMFKGAGAFNQAIGNWDVSQVTDMSQMFEDAAAFNADIGSWNTLIVTDMTSMFKNATSFNQDLSDWCVRDISQAPSGFDQGASAWTLSRPGWAGCAVIFQDRFQ